MTQIETFTEYLGLSNNRVFFTVQTFNPRHKSIQYLQKCNRLRAALTRWAFVWCTNRNRVSTIFSVFYSYFQVANHNPPPTFLATNVWHFVVFCYVGKSKSIFWRRVNHIKMFRWWTSYAWRKFYCKRRVQIHAKKSVMEINVHQIKHACLTCFFRKYCNLWTKPRIIKQNKIIDFRYQWLKLQRLLKKTKTFVGVFLYLNYC